MDYTCVIDFLRVAVLRYCSCVIAVYTGSILTAFRVHPAPDFCTACRSPTPHLRFLSLRFSTRSAAPFAFCAFLDYARVALWMLVFAGLRIGFCCTALRFYRFCLAFSFPELPAAHLVDSGCPVTGRFTPLLTRSACSTVSPSALFPFHLHYALRSAPHSLRTCTRCCFSFLSVAAALLTPLPHTLPGLSFLRSLSSTFFLPPACLH